MKLIPVNCPRCNSRQKFAPHKRVLADGMIESYCNCKMCHHEIVLERGKHRRRRTHRLVPRVR